MAKIYGQNSKYLEKQHAYHDGNFRGYLKAILVFGVLASLIAGIGIGDLIKTGNLGILLLGVATIAICFVLDRFVRYYAKHSRNYRKGQTGEWDVKVELSRLPDNYAIICDAMLTGKSFNIDFILSGPKGVYAIEVKNYASFSKHAEEGAVKQTERGSWEIQKYINQVGAGQTFVKPLLVLAGNNLPLPVRKGGKFCTILNKDQLLKFILSQSDVKNQSNIPQIESHLVLLTVHNI